MIKEIPILFSTPMVQAILEGRKTQTRRLIKWPKVPDWHNWDYEPNQLERPQGGGWWPWFYHRNAKKDISGPLKCPYGQGGDWLWVKETHYAYGWWIQEGKTKTGLPGWTFKDFTPEDQGGKYHFVTNPPAEVIEKRTAQKMGWYKRPSIFMPKEAARIWLQVESVRVERLQDISPLDAKLEGIEPIEFSGAMLGWRNYLGKKIICKKATDSFKSLWESINGADSWHANPWTWVISFTVLSTTGKPDLQTT